MRRVSAALPSEIKGMFLIRARRSLGLTAHRGWARLLIDRMYTQVQRPEFPQAPEPAWGYLSPADWLASPKSPNPRMLGLAVKRSDALSPAPPGEVRREREVGGSKKTMSPLCSVWCIVFSRASL